MLVRANDGPVHEVDTPVHRAGGVRLPLDGRQDPIPDPGHPPPPQPAGHGRPRTIPLRQIPPRCAGPQAPQDAIDDPPMVHVRPARLRFLRREVRLQSLPLLVAQLSSVSHANGGANSGPPIWLLCTQTLTPGRRHRCRPLARAASLFKPIRSPPPRQHDRDGDRQHTGYGVRGVGDAAAEWSEKAAAHAISRPSQQSRSRLESPTTSRC